MWEGVGGRNLIRYPPPQALRDVEMQEGRKDRVVKGGRRGEVKMIKDGGTGINTHGWCSWDHSSQFVCNHTGSGLGQSAHRHLYVDMGSSSKGSLCRDRIHN